MKRSLALGTKIYVSVTMLLVLLSVTGYMTFDDAQRDDRLSEIAVTANRMSDYFIRATGHYAVERGVSAVILSKREGSVLILAEKMKERRKKGDAAFQEAMNLLGELIELQPQNKSLRHAFEHVQDRRKNFENARERVDSWVNERVDGLTPRSWINRATAYIFSQTSARRVAFHSKDPLQYAAEMNLTVKQHIWAASENAGIIRAKTGAAISFGKSLPLRKYTEIMILNGIVESNLEAVRAVSKGADVDPRLVLAIEEMDRAYGKEYGAIRKQVFEGFRTGEYPLNGEQWISVATKGIDSILAVSTAASLAPAEALEIAREGFESKVFFTIGIIGAAFAICFFLVLYLGAKVFRPLVEMIEKLRTMSAGIRFASRDMARSSEELSSTASEQAASIAETAASMEELSVMVTNNVSQAENSKGLSENMHLASERGSVQMKDLVQSMQEIRKSNQDIQALVKVISEIGEKTKVIDDIVFQTKILSFNASVEAERAGEHGRGFSVVAQEVSNLAETSGKAAGEIASMVSESIKRAEGVTQSSRDKVEAGDRLVQEVAKVLGMISTNAHSVSGSVQQIAGASKEQASGISQVNAAISELDQSTQSTASSAEEAAASSESLDQEAMNLSTIVDRLVVLIEGSARDSESLAGRDSFHDPSEGEGVTNVVPLEPRKRRPAKDTWVDDTDRSETKIASTGSGDWEKI